MRLRADLRDRLEVRANGEDYAARFGKAAEGLAFGAEEVVVDGFVFLLSYQSALLHKVCERCTHGSVPSYFLSVFGAYALAPRELVVDLDEVVVPDDWTLGLESSEEVCHWLDEC